MVVAQDGFAVADFQVNELGHLLDAVCKVNDAGLQALPQIFCQFCFERADQLVQPFPNRGFGAENSRKGTAQEGGKRKPLLEFSRFEPYGLVKRSQ